MILMDEYIKREAAIDAVTAVYVRTAGYKTRERVWETREAIQKLPAADVAPVVHGVWIPVHESEISGWYPEVAGIDPIGGYICSACKNEAIYDCNDKFVLSDYCPNCGARMDGDSDAFD